MERCRRLPKAGSPFEDNSLACAQKLDDLFQFDVCIVRSNNVMQLSLTYVILHAKSVTKCLNICLRCLAPSREDICNVKIYTQRLLNIV